MCCADEGGHILPSCETMTQGGACQGCRTGAADDAACLTAQLEEAAVRELQSQNVQEAGAEAADYSDLQVLLTSSQDFGPASIRDLTVRSCRVVARSRPYGG